MTQQRKGWRDWLIGAMFTIVMAVGSCVANQTSAAIKSTADQVVELSGTVSNRGERIATVEAEYKALSESVKDLKDNDKRIEAKIDQLLQRKR